MMTQIQTFVYNRTYGFEHIFKASILIDSTVDWKLIEWRLLHGFPEKDPVISYESIAWKTFLIPLLLGEVF